MTKSKLRLPLLLLLLLIFFFILLKEVADSTRYIVCVIFTRSLASVVFAIVFLTCIVHNLLQALSS
jgi:hypothetical protein